MIGELLSKIDGKKLYYNFIMSDWDNEKEPDYDSDLWERDHVEADSDLWERNLVVFNNYTEDSQHCREDFLNYMAKRREAAAMEEQEKKVAHEKMIKDIDEQVALLNLSDEKSIETRNEFVDWFYKRPSIKDNESQEPRKWCVRCGFEIYTHEAWHYSNQEEYTYCATCQGPQGIYDYTEPRKDGTSKHELESWRPNTGTLPLSVQPYALRSVYPANSRTKKRV
jgi:hypothetical protein